MINELITIPIISYSHQKIIKNFKSYKIIFYSVHIYYAKQQTIERHGKRSVAYVKKNVPTEFGAIIKKRIVDLNTSQTELAKKIGTSTVFLNQMIHGVRPGEKYIKKICRELDLNIKI